MMATYNTSTPSGGQLPPHQQYQQVQRIQQAQASQTRPDTRDTRASEKGRTKPRSFSIRSDKSSSSNGNHRHDTIETHAEKESRRLHSKADPTLAMNEAEPSAVAAEVKSNFTPLREIAHLDNNGNPISEPDVSNPTRYRWERPLDTIRSFEAAIDGQYNNRKSALYQSSDIDSVAGGPTRRNSYYNNSNNSNSRFPQDAYYARPQSYLPSPGSQLDMRQGRDDGYGGGGYGYNNNGGYGGGGQRPRYNRMASESQYHQPQYRQNDVYPGPAGINHRSYETVASGSGSGSGVEPAGYQTDPTSSDNSSIERRHSPLKQQQYANNNAYSGNGKAPSSRLAQTQNSSNNPLPPPPPPQHNSNSLLRKATQQSSKPDAGHGEKQHRKSWLSRKLSRRN